MKKLIFPLLIFLISSCKMYYTQRQAEFSFVTLIQIDTMIRSDGRELLCTWVDRRGDTLFTIQELDFPYKVGMKIPSILEK